MTALIELRGILVRFGGLAALGGVDLAVNPGEIIGVIGPNGAGKSTLFNAITGFVRPTAGSVLLAGDDITGRSPDQIARLGIARTYQNIRLFGAMTALENCLAGLHRHLRSSVFGAVFRGPGTRAEEHDAARRAGGLLAQVGLAGREDEVAASMPYGDQRRLEIARALAVGPRVLLLDEPTAGMNPRESADVAGLIRRIRDETGTAIVLIEHDMSVVMGISDRVAVLDHGVKITEGLPTAVQQNPDVIAAYLGVEATS